MDIFTTSVRKYQKTLRLMGRLWCHLLPILVVGHLEILTVILEGGDKNSNLRVNWRITLALRILVVIMFKYFRFAYKIYIEVIEVKHHIFPNCLIRTFQAEDFSFFEGFVKIFENLVSLEVKFLCQSLCKLFRIFAISFLLKIFRNPLRFWKSTG